MSFIFRPNQIQINNQHEIERWHECAGLLHAICRTTKTVHLDSFHRCVYIYLSLILMRCSYFPFQQYKLWFCASRYLGFFAERSATHTLWDIQWEMLINDDMQWDCVWVGKSVRAQISPFCILIVRRKRDRIE